MQSFNFKKGRKKRNRPCSIHFYNEFRSDLLKSGSACQEAESWAARICIPSQQWALPHRSCFNLTSATLLTRRTLKFIASQFKGEAGKKEKACQGTAGNPKGCPRSNSSSSNPAIQLSNTTNYNTHRHIGAHTTTSPPQYLILFHLGTGIPWNERKNLNIPSDKC